LAGFFFATFFLATFFFATFFFAIISPPLMENIKSERKNYTFIINYYKKTCNSFSTTDLIKKKLIR
jgi:hypothetical protein